MSQIGGPVPGTKKYKKEKKGLGTTSTEAAAKKAWLKKTRNSPAAKSGRFTDDERWALQQKHREWKANRSKAKIKKKKRARKSSGYQFQSNLMKDYNK